MDISAWIYLNMCKLRQEATFVFWIQKIQDKSRLKIVYINGPSCLCAHKGTLI